MAGNAWSDGEVTELRRYYRKKGSRWEGWKTLLPRRSIHAIETKAYSLGLRHERYWTPEQDEILRLYYENKNKYWDGWRRVLPGKTRKQMSDRAWHLGLKSPHAEWTDDERRRLVLAVNSVSKETGHTFLGCVKELNNMRLRSKA